MNGGEHTVNFKGHEIVEIVSDEWVIDITEFKVYKIRKTNDTLHYKLAFNIETNDIGAVVVCNKTTRVPLRVIKEALKIAEDTLKVMNGE